MREQPVPRNRPDDDTLGSNKPEKLPEEEWRKEFRALKSLRKQLLQKVFPEDGSTNKPLYKWFKEKQNAYYDLIKTGGFEDVRTKYGAYHVNVGGSSTGPDSSPFVDFPEPYSLKTYYTKALEELEQIERKEEK